METSESSKVEYRYIDFGHGGTFQFNKGGTAEEQNPNIGTFDIVTCTGIYLPIDSNRCFVAHIEPFYKAGGEYETERQRQWVIDNVLRALQSHSQRHGWSAKTVADFVNHPKAIHKPIIACPMMKAPAVGSPVFEAIDQFLRPYLDADRFKDSATMGFVLNHKTGKFLDTFKFNDPISNPDNEAAKYHERHYEQLHATDATHDWEFSIPPDDQLARDELAAQRLARQ